MALRNENLYNMDYEDMGGFGSPTVDEIIAQIVAQTPVVTPVAQVEQKPMTTAEVVKELVASGTFEQNPNQAVLIDGTYYQPNFASTGSGETFEQGPLENVTVYKEAENKVGGDVNQYSPSGEYQQTTKQQEVNAVKDLMDFAAIAGTMFGVPAGIGEALGLSGATGAAVGQGALTTATQLGSGESLGDALKAGLVSGGLVYGGNQLGDLANTSSYDSVAAADTASGLSPKYGTTYDEIMSNLIGDESSQLALQSIVNPPAVATPVPEQTPFNGTITSPIETVQVTAPQAPVAPTVADVISSIVQTQVAPSMPEVVVTDQRPTTEERPITIQPPSSITEDTTPIPVITPSKPIDTTIPEKKYTTAEIVDMVRLGLAGAGLLAGANAASSGPKQYDIVPLPEDWKSPVYQKDLPTTAPTQLPHIDFGNRNLLIGTQWEKFLDPNYGKIPTPVQFNQPSNMSYDRLMGILGTGRDTLPSQALSINDVISGIQNQYGQKS